MAGPAEFAHLHVASSYSLRYGTATPAALAARAADLGLSALALTDRDGLYGAFKHVQACADAGIRPLLGADLGVRASDGASRVTLLATGRQGWASLCRLVSAAHASAETEAGAGTGTKTGDAPAVTPELIAEHAAGLVMLLGPASDVGQAVAARRQDLARRALGRWRRHVDAVVEIVDHLDHKSTFRAARMAELARDTRTPAVLTNAVRYLDPVDSLTAQVLDAARHLVPLGSPRLVKHNGRAYLASQEDMTVTARRVAAAMTGPGTASAATLLLGETDELARRCVLDPVRDLGVGSRHLPETKGTAYDQYKELKDRCERVDPAGPLPDGERGEPPARRQPPQSRGKRPRPPRPRARHHRADRHGRLLPHGGRRRDEDQAGRHPLRHPGLRRGQLRQPPARHQRDRPARARPAHGAVPLPDKEHAPGHRPGRGVGPPPGRVPDHLRPLRPGARRLRLHDGDLPGAQRDQGRRRRDVAAARRDRRDREVLPAHPRQAHHRRAHGAAGTTKIKAQ